MTDLRKRRLHEHFYQDSKKWTLSVGEMMHELILTIKCAEFNFFI